ncbi:MAG TPA: SDR family NAD(P)-dependent oxidoreductase [Roseiarcus sp.]|nr:SDR family NAD(P)-dependent oxidoreductase [Roseiarcus sp.]
MAEKVWFITGASRGFGRLWTEAALRRGDKVAATARDTTILSDLSEKFRGNVLPLELDVANPDAVGVTVNQAHRHFGRLDVILTNAGYGLMGALEETTIEEARANFDTNVFGTFSTIKSALPLLRAQRRGHILAVSSVGGLVTFPMAIIYQATKFAVEGLIQSLAQEVSAFGVKVTLIEPGPFKTDFISSTSLRNTKPIAAYDPVRERAARMLTPEMFGDPRTTSDTILRVVDAEEPPLHVILGSLLPLVKQAYAARVESWQRWDDGSGGLHAA